MSEQPTEPTGPTGSTEPVPEVPLTIDDLLSDITVVQQKEAADKAIFDAISGLPGIPLPSLRQALGPWAAQGFPNAYTVQEIVIQPPSRCSDGVTRALADYITFVSGKTMAEHIAVLQSRLSGITVGYAWSGSAILLVVSRTSAA